MLKRKPYPIPRIAQMLQELEEFTYETSLDLNMGYYTIKLDYDSQKRCNIVTPFGKYQYLRLPMGISCSPYISQEKMSDLMLHLNFVRTYLDGVLIISCSTWESFRNIGMCSKNVIWQRFTRKCWQINLLCWRNWVPRVLGQLVRYITYP
jgi:hypothetical protein